MSQVDEGYQVIAGAVFAASPGQIRVVLQNQESGEISVKEVPFSP